MNPAKKKTVLITGSSLGIGAATAVAFAHAGYAVIITYQKNRKQGAEVESACLAAGAPATLVHELEITDANSIRRLVREVVKTFGTITVLVNNAGVVTWKKLPEQTENEIKQQIRVNLEGLILMTKAMLPYVTDTVINIASGAGLSASDEIPVYVATKFGVRGFTQAMALDHPELMFITVNPGATATRMTDFTGDPPEKVAQVILNAAQREYDIQSGDDVNVWEVS